MPSFLPRGRERVLWLVAAAYVLSIYGSAYFVRFASEHLRERGVLGATVAGVGAAGAVAFLAWWARDRPGLRAWALLPIAGAVYAAVWLHLERFEERIHLPEYGLLGLLLHEAMVEHWRGAREPLRRIPALAAFALACGIGWLDEGVQHLLPNRYYDLRDVALNAVSAGLAIGLAALRRRAGRRAAVEWPAIDPPPKETG